MWPSGPSERRLPNASARGRALTSHRALGMSTINSDEHDAEHGVRSGAEQPLAPEHRDKPGASSYQQVNPKNSEVM